MRHYAYFLIFLSFSTVFSQDLSQGYIANDIDQHPMQPLAKPGYLRAVTDPSFPSTSIRRISEANPGQSIVPAYNTIQAWNADESLMIVYVQGGGGHRLLNGTDYTFIRNLNDIRPNSLEDLFWHFSNPDILFYMDAITKDLIRYNVRTTSKTILANMITLSGCRSGISSGNDVQMMSWDSDVFSFRCGNESAYYYRISTGVITEFNIADINYTAPMPFPSGNLFYHNTSVYDANGNFVRELNIKGGEHACLGKLSNGDDAYFAISFAEGPNGGCLGTLVAHNATNGNCFSVTPTEEYGYSKTGTHISALAHNNSEGGWVAVSSVGYEEDGVKVLDQELFIAKVDEFEGTVYRVAHHRSDEHEFSYWGEPHVTISPSGTRLLFGSDWSGSEDGVSVDSYVAELAAYSAPEEEEECTAESIVPEYRLNGGDWISGENELTVDYGTELMFSMLPDGIGLSIEFPDGTIVGDEYNIGEVTPADSGTYTLTSAEGCTTTIELTVKEEVFECGPDSIVPEYRLNDGDWMSGASELTVDYGTEIMFSMLPNGIGLSVELPDGNIVGDEHDIGAVTPADSGTYTLTSAEGCTTTIELTVEEEVFECGPESIIAEYRLDGGDWMSGESELTVDYGTELMFSMLPDGIGLSVEFPDGTIVGDEYNIGEVKPADSGTYTLTSAEGCITTLELTVNEEEFKCSPESIIAEYRLDGGDWMSGANELTIDYGTELMFSMLPDGIGLSVEFPDGTIVGDEYNLGEVTPADSGTYTLTSAEGCTTTVELTVEKEEIEGCAPERIVPEYRVNGVWSSGANELTVAYGTSLMFSMLPNHIGLKVEFPDGTVVGDNYNIGAVSPANNGTYTLVSAEGCRTTIELTVEEQEIVDCTPERIIPEYRLNGVWSSGANELTLAYGTRLMFSMLPNRIGLSVEFPDGTVVGDNYNIGAVTPADNGVYTLTSAEGCTTSIELSVEDEEIVECTPERIIPEYRLDGVWSSGANELTVDSGTEIVFSMLPNRIGLKVEFPDGRIVGDNYNIGAVTPTDNGIYTLFSAEGCQTTIALTVTENKDSKLEGLDFLPNEANAAIYPNPTEGLLNIVFNEFEDQRVGVTILESSGRVVHKQIFDSDHAVSEQLNLNDNLSDGVYFLVLDSATKRSTFSIIVRNP